MNRNNFDEEEVTENEMKSVAFTTASFAVIVIAVASWILLA